MPYRFVDILRQAAITYAETHDNGGDLIESHPYYYKGTDENGRMNLAARLNIVLHDVVDNREAKLELVRWMFGIRPALVSTKQLTVAQGEAICKLESRLPDIAQELRIERERRKTMEPV
jgi:hypothetical protein